MFVCLGFIVPLENFSLICRRHHNWWRVANFDLCSALMAIEQWGFFSVPHLLWHGVSVYNYHLRGPVPLTPIAERLAVELSVPLFTISVCRGWDSNTQPPNALIHCATAAVHLMHIWPQKNAYLTPQKACKILTPPKKIFLKNVVLQNILQCAYIYLLIIYLLYTHIKSQISILICDALNANEVCPWMLMRKCLLVMVVILMLILMIHVLNLDKGCTYTDADLCIKLMPLYCYLSTWRTTAHYSYVPNSNNSATQRPKAQTLSNFQNTNIYITDNWNTPHGWDCKIQCPMA